MSAEETVLTQRRFCNRCGSPLALDAPACDRCGAPQAGDPVSPAAAAAQVGPRKTNGMAIASLVLGIVWLGWLGSILAVIFGHMAQGQIRRAQGGQGGRGMATAGLILGYIGVATLVAVVALVTFGAMFSHS